MSETLGSLVMITIVIIGFENVQKGKQVKYPHWGLRVLNSKRTLTNSRHAEMVSGTYHLHTLNIPLSH